MQRIFRFWIRLKSHPDCDDTKKGKREDQKERFGKELEPGIVIRNRSDLAVMNYRFEKWEKVQESEPGVKVTRTVG